MTMTFCTIGVGAAQPTPVSVSPEFQRLPSPVIIVGMHRSGTSLVAGMLTILGVYLDPELPVPCTEGSLSVPNASLRQNGYGEATCFRLLNEEIMAQAGAHWHHIAPFMAQRENPVFRSRSLRRMQMATHQELKTQFLAPLPPDYTGPWGWKDPRNSLTLPYWSALFPHARILHVRRNPEDIAESLMRRAKAEARAAVDAPPLSAKMRLQQAVRSPKSALRFAAKRLGIERSPSAPIYSMQEKADCLKLSDAYVQACLPFRAYGERYLEIWYEDIVQEPESYAHLLAAFLNIAPSAHAIAQATLFVQPRSELLPASPCLEHSPRQDKQLSSESSAAPRTEKTFRA